MKLPTILILGIILLSGILFGRLVKQFKLPNVTGYLIAGLIIGPYCLGIIPKELIEPLHLVSEVALGFIAFNIGTEFKISYFKKVGATPIIIAFMEASVATILVTVVCLLFRFDLCLSIMLGAIAAATAPAATVMVVKQYKARGPVSETLLSVVAIDDAAALMLYGFAAAIVNTISNPSGGVSIMTVLSPIIEIVLSLVIGAIMALIYKIFLKYFKKGSNRLISIAAILFIGTGISNMLHLSSLLMCMACGATLVNISSATLDVVKQVDNFTPPIFVGFFALSGAELNLAILPQIGLIGVLYIVSRVIGKILGASLGAIISKASPTIKKYIGFTLIPQAGVAIGLSLMAAEMMPEYGDTIRAVILCGTLIYELIGPAITKFALVKAGEIKTA